MVKWSHIIHAGTRKNTAYNGDECESVHAVDGEEKIRGKEIEELKEETGRTGAELKEETGRTKAELQESHTP